MMMRETIRLAGIAACALVGASSCLAPSPVGQEDQAELSGDAYLAAGMVSPKYYRTENGTSPLLAATIPALDIASGFKSNAFVNVPASPDEKKTETTTPAKAPSGQPQTETYYNLNQQFRLASQETMQDMEDSSAVGAKIDGSYGPVTASADVGYSSKTQTSGSSLEILFSGRISWTAVPALQPQYSSQFIEDAAKLAGYFDPKNPGKLISGKEAEAETDAQAFLGAYGQGYRYNRDEGAGYSLRIQITTDSKSSASALKASLKLGVSTPVYGASAQIDVNKVNSINQSSKQIKVEFTSNGFLLADKTSKDDPGLLALFTAMGGADATPHGGDKPAESPLGKIVAGISILNSRLTQSVADNLCLRQGHRYAQIVDADGTPQVFRCMDKESADKTKGIALANGYFSEWVKDRSYFDSFPNAPDDAEEKVVTNVKLIQKNAAYLQSLLSKQVKRVLLVGPIVSRMLAIMSMAYAQEIAPVIAKKDSPTDLANFQIAPSPFNPWRAPARSTADLVSVATSQAALFNPSGGTLYSALQKYRTDCVLRSRAEKNFTVCGVSGLPGPSPEQQILGINQVKTAYLALYNYLDHGRILPLQLAQNNDPKLAYEWVPTSVLNEDNSDKMCNTIKSTAGLPIYRLPDQYEVSYMGTLNGYVSKNQPVAQYMAYYQNSDNAMGGAECPDGSFPVFQAGPETSTSSSDPSLTNRFVYSCVKRSDSTNKWQLTAYCVPKEGPIGAPLDLLQFMGGLVPRPRLISTTPPDRDEATKNNIAVAPGDAVTFIQLVFSRDIDFTSIGSGDDSNIRVYKCADDACRKPGAALNVEVLAGKKLPTPMPPANYLNRIILIKIKAQLNAGDQVAVLLSNNLLGSSVVAQRFTYYDYKDGDANKATFAPDDFLWSQRYWPQKEMIPENAEAADKAGKVLTKPSFDLLIYKFTSPVDSWKWETHSLRYFLPVGTGKTLQMKGTLDPKIEVQSGPLPWNDKVKADMFRRDALCVDLKFKATLNYNVFNFIKVLYDGKEVPAPGEGEVPKVGQLLVPEKKQSGYSSFTTVSVCAGGLDADNKSWADAKGQGLIKVKLLSGLPDKAGNTLLFNDFVINPDGK